MKFKMIVSSRLPFVLAGSRARSTYCNHVLAAMSLNYERVYGKSHQTRSALKVMDDISVKAM